MFEIKTSKLVEQILRANEIDPDYKVGPRDSDKILRLQVWQYQGLALSKAQKKFFIEQAADSKSIGRHRRMLQAKGLYPASPAVAENRKKNESKISKTFAQNIAIERSETVQRGYIDDNGEFVAI